MSDDTELSKQDLLISACLDGELSDEARTQFEHFMETEEAFRVKFAERKHHHDLMSKAFAQVDESAMPESVMAMLEQKADVVPLRTKAGFPLPLAMAASVLLVGVLTMFYMGADKTPNGANLVAELNRALDSSLSGSMVTLEDEQDSRLLINLSFVDGQNRHCREYYLSQGTAQTLQRISCKGASGWQTEVEVVSDRVLESNRFRPASGAISEDIEKYLELNMQSDAFDRDQESEAIASGWESKQS